MALATICEADLKYELKNLQIHKKFNWEITMTRLVLDLTKSIDQNAAVYFEKAKKTKKKLKALKGR